MAQLQLVDDFERTPWGDTIKLDVDDWRSVTRQLGTIYTDTCRLRKAASAPTHHHERPLVLTVVLIPRLLGLGPSCYEKRVGLRMHRPPGPALNRHRGVEHRSSIYTVGGGWEVAQADLRSSFECNLTCARSPRALLYAVLDLFLVLSTCPRSTRDTTSRPKASFIPTISPHKVLVILWPT